MSDTPSSPKDNPSGKRKTKPGETVPALDARAAAEEALRRAEEKLGLGETLIVHPTEGINPDERVLIPREALVSPSEGTLILNREEFTPPSGLDPNATARLPRRDMVSPSEGTVIMASVPPMPGGMDPVIEADTQPGLTPEPSPHEGTMRMPLADLQPMVRPEAPSPRVPETSLDKTLIVLPPGPGEHPASEGTMIMPMADLQPLARPEALPVVLPDSSLDLTLMVPMGELPDPTASEGTMIMPMAGLPLLSGPEGAPAAAPTGSLDSTVMMPAGEPAGFGASEGTMMMPMAGIAADVVPSTEASEGTMVMPMVGIAAEVAPTDEAREGAEVVPAEVTPPVDEDTRPDLAAAPDAREEVTRAGEGVLGMPTAAELIREALPDEPPLEARTIRVTQAHLPELRQPEIPEPMHLPPAVEAEAPVEPEPDLEGPRATLHMPLRDMPEARYREGRPHYEAPVTPVEATEVLQRFDPSPEPDRAPEEPAAAPRQPQGGVGEAAPPGRSFTAVWIGVIGVLALGIAGVWMWQVGVFGGSPDTAGPQGPTPKVEPATVDEGAKVPEQLRPAYEKALAGDPNAMRMLGVCFVNGLGVPADRAEGLKWYRRAAAAGSTAAQRELQVLESQGIR